MPRVLVMHDSPEGRIVAFDSAGHVAAAYTDGAGPDKDVIVNASYNGVLPARMLLAAGRPRAAIGLDCGIGKDGVGIAGLWFFEALNIPAAAADVMTAEMGNGEDLYESGAISRVNALAALAGVQPGMSVKEAAALLLQWPGDEGRSATGEQRDNRLVVVTHPSGREIVCIDSIYYATAADANNVLCVAGHGGKADEFRRVRPWGFICSDGGRGKNDSGIAALWEVEADGLAGACVDANTARMGDGVSTYMDGIISACNRHAARRGVKVGQTAKEAARLLLEG